MAAYIALFISLVSLILMIVILVRFKKLFSTDSIIEKTKSQMNRVIIDVNNHANRDLELLNESTRRLKSLLNEADKKMENFREASELLRDTIAEAEKTGASHKNKIVYVENDKLSEIKPVGQKSKKNPYVDPDAAYSVRRDSPAQQRSLFDEPEEESILKDETVVTPDGAAYKEVPLIITKVYDDKAASAEQAAASSQTAAAQSKNLKEKVERLFNQGMQIEDIAVELSCSISEVQFIIDML